jgi:hypothetical protein
MAFLSAALFAVGLALWIAGAVKIQDYTYQVSLCGLNQPPPVHNHLHAAALHPTFTVPPIVAAGDAHVGDTQYRSLAAPALLSARQHALHVSVLVARLQHTPAVQTAHAGFHCSIASIPAWASF